MPGCTGLVTPGWSAIAARFWLAVAVPAAAIIIAAGTTAAKIARLLRPRLLGQSRPQRALLS
ncbi:hypothetical protein ACWEQA_05810 [Nocardia sp. NPDC004085]